MHTSFALGYATTEKASIHRLSTIGSDTLAWLA